MGFDLFNLKKPPLIGVDISSSSIKMVELSRSKSGMKLERYAITHLEDGVVVDGVVNHPDGLSVALEECISRLGSKVKHSAAALPNAFIVMKPAKLRGDLTEKEMEDEVNSELANLISFDINEAGVDFKVLDETLNTELNEVTVYMYATLRQRVDERANALEVAGLKPLVIDSEFLTTLDVFEKYVERNGLDYTDKTVLVMDLGATATHFTFLRNGEAVYSRDHAFGGSQFSRDLQEQLSLSPQDAEKIKSKGPDDENAALFNDILKNFVDAAATEARRAVQLFTTSTNFTAVDTVLVHGGGAVASGLVEAVREILSVDTNLWNPFEGMDISPSIDARKFSKDASSLAVACGLAMRRFDK